MRVPVILAVASLAVAGCAEVLPQVGPQQPRGPGALHEDYLAGDGDRLVVELDHVPGALWDESTDAEADFVDQVERITNKEVVVETDASLPAQGDDYTYGIEELVELHEAHQDREGGNGTTVMHALFLDGEFQGTTAGLAFEADAFALFKGTIEESGSTCANDALVCGGPTQPAVREWELTRAVAIHEAGHLVGLVNCPLPMVTDHEMTQDPEPSTDANEGECHSDNEDSVMYWQVAAEGGPTSIVDGGEVPWTFDRHDLEDARALQEGHPGEA